MPDSPKITISLPADLLRRIEAERARSGETVSGFIRRAVKEAFEKRARDEKVARYVEGYRRRPETRAEVKAAEAAAAKFLALDD